VLFTPASIVQASSTTNPSKFTTVCADAEVLRAAQTVSETKDNACLIFMMLSLLTFKQMD